MTPKPRQGSYKRRIGLWCVAIAGAAIVSLPNAHASSLSRLSAVHANSAALSPDKSLASSTLRTEKGVHDVAFRGPHINSSYARLQMTVLRSGVTLVAWTNGKAIHLTSFSSSGKLVSDHVLGTTDNGQVQTALNADGAAVVSWGHRVDLRSSDGTTHSCRLAGRSLLSVAISQTGAAVVASATSSDDDETTTILLQTVARSGACGTPQTLQIAPATSFSPGRILTPNLPGICPGSGGPTAIPLLDDASYFLGGQDGLFEAPASVDGDMVALGLVPTGMWLLVDNDGDYTLKAVGCDGATYSHSDPTTGDVAGVATSSRGRAIVLNQTVDNHVSRFNVQTLGPGVDTVHGLATSDDAFVDGLIPTANGGAAVAELHRLQGHSTYTITLISPNGVPQTTQVALDQPADGIYALVADGVLVSSGKRTAVILDHGAIVNRHPSTWRDHLVARVLSADGKLGAARPLLTLTNREGGAGSIVASAMNAHGRMTVLTFNGVGLRLITGNV